MRHLLIGRRALAIAQCAGHSVRLCHNGTCSNLEHIRVMLVMYYTPPAHHRVEREGRPLK
jgi:hypothetical protein